MRFLYSLIGGVLVVGVMLLTTLSFSDVTSTQRDVILKQLQTLEDEANTFYQKGECEMVALRNKQKLDLQLQLFKPASPEVTNTLFVLARLHKHGCGDDLEVAEEYYQTLLNNFLTDGGNHQSKIARVATELAETYHKQGDYDRALYYTQKAIDLKSAVYGDRHPSVLDQYDELAWAHYWTGNFEQAIKTMAKQKAFYTQKYSEDHIKTGTAIKNTGDLYLQNRQYQKAMDYYDQAETILKDSKYISKSEVASLLFNRARASFYLGRYDKAYSLFERALKSQEDLYYDDSEYFATVLKTLASYYFQMGYTEEAKPLFKKSLAMLRKRFAEYDPPVLSLVNRLSNYYYTIGQGGQAVTQIESSHQRVKDQLSAEDHRYAAALNSYAFMYVNLEKYDKAMSYSDHSLVIRKNLLSADHKDLAKSLDSRAYIHFLKGEFISSLNNYQRALDIIAHDSTMDYLKEDIMEYQLKNYVALGQWDQAVAVGQNISTYVENKYGESDIKTGSCLIKLASLYAQRHEDQQVLESLTKALVIFAKAYGENHFRTVAVREIMVNYSLKRSIDHLRKGLKSLLADLKIINQMLGIEDDIKIHH